MKAVVLVGGRGTRLRPLTFSVPKPLLAVGDRPILQLILERLKDAGVTEVILATGYLGELVEAFCGDGSRFGISISYVREDRPLGTAGPLSLVRDRFDSEELFLVMNGDIVTKVQFASMIAHARRTDCRLTVGHVEVSYQSPYGVLTIEDETIVDITEKPSFSYSVSSGIYVLKGSALEYVPDNEFFTVPDLIRCLRAAGHPVGAHHIPESWLAVEEVAHIELGRRLVNEDAAEVEA